MKRHFSVATSMIAVFAVIFSCSPLASGPEVETVSVALTATSVAVGQSLSAVATLRDATGLMVEGPTVTWSVTDPAVASITSSGPSAQITALTPGTTGVTASSKGQSGNATLTVASPISLPVASVSVSLGSSSINPGQSTQASATTRDAGNNVLMGRTITWSSNNTGVATVSNSGVVAGVATGNAQITASSESQSGSAALSVTTPPVVPVASVSVSLAFSSLNPGEMTQATATTRDANNIVLTGRAISWSSSNTSVATVSSSGVVTALAVGGPIQITATSESKSGSAALTVAAPPPPPPGGSVEPAGMTPVTERPFSAITEDGWSLEYGTSQNLSIQQDALAPKSALSILEMRFPAGFTAGAAPNSLERGLSGGTTLYFAYWMKVSSNWYGQETSTNKVFHFWIGGLNRLYTSVHGAGNGALSTWVNIQGVVTGGQFDGGTNGDFGPNLGAPGTIVRGQWHHYEFIFKANTSGQADGSIEWWLDGVKVGSKGGIQWVSGAGQWETVKWSPTWGGLGGSVPADQFMSLDHLYISRK